MFDLIIKQFDYDKKELITILNMESVPMDTINIVIDKYDANPWLRIDVWLHRPGDDLRLPRYEDEE